MPGTVFDQPPTVQQKLAMADWPIQMRQRARSWEDLFRIRPDLEGSAVAEALKCRRSVFESASRDFRFSVTPYYLSLASRDYLCPIWKQILPDADEIADRRFFNPDPLAEETHMPVPGLTHRYPDRVLWYISHNCAVYCRFCMRKRKVSRGESAPTGQNLEKALEYIRNHPEILEVILSGGDPLSQSDAALDYLLKELRQIPHVASIRIHSRMPVTCPQRITTGLCEALENHGPITFVTHFNHALEMSKWALEAIQRLKKSGTTVLNQSVLLRGINDSTEEQRALNLALLKMGVKPYYLHQCDEVRGVSHFRVDLRKGIQIQKDLRGRIPGIGLPLYVIDLPGGGGKVPVDSSYFLNRDPHAPVFENYAGQSFEAMGDEL